mmetsp:Transcript_31168/g.42877  ORF Transcript_31168/g.42877 Transcript_31168/m.42877 type:complete len:260 (+) Transcript_31168:222-1001(+)
MVEKWGKDFHKDVVIAGASAGTILAVGICMGFSPDEIGELYLKTAQEAKCGIFHKGMLSLEHNCLRKLIEDPETFRKLEGKCHIGITGFLTEHFWASSWKDNEDLLNCLKGSLHVPLVCDLIEPVADVHVVDGAYGFAGSSLLALHGDDTLYIAPDPSADICTSLSTRQLLFPSEGEAFKELVQHGYESFMSWDGSHKMKVARRQPNRPVLVVLWLCKFVALFIAFLMRFMNAMSSKLHTKRLYNSAWGSSWYLGKKDC